MPPRLCTIDGSRAGCGPCVRAAGHPLGGTEYHRDATGGHFYTVEPCPHCSALLNERNEGPTVAEHIREEHGGVGEREPVRQLGLFAGGA